MKMKSFLQKTLITLIMIVAISCENQTDKSEKRAEAWNRSLSIYDRRLQEWPVDFTEKMVETKYGLSHVIISGPNDGEPLFLIHAMGVGSTMWLPNIDALSQVYRVYAIDTIGDLNKSVLADIDYYPKKGSDYSAWFVELLDALEVKRTGIIAASMGAWIGLNVALNYPERVSKLALLGPMGIRSNVLQVSGKITSVLLNPSEKNKRSMISWALGDKQVVQEAFSDYMYIAVEAPGKMGFPSNLESKELKQIITPVLLLLGGQDRPIGNPKPVQAKAEKYLPKVEVEILEGCGHLMNYEQAQTVNSLLLEFFRSKE